MTEKTREEKLASDIAMALNVFGFDEKEFCEQMSREHRTLQQNFMRLVISWIRCCAEFKPHQYDERNEDSVRICRKLAEKLNEEDAGLRFI